MQQLLCQSRRREEEPKQSASVLKFINALPRSAFHNLSQSQKVGQQKHHLHPENLIAMPAGVKAPKVFFLLLFVCFVFLRLWM